MHITTAETPRDGTENTHRECLVIELPAVDGFAAGAGFVREVATLEHELGTGRKQHNDRKQTAPANTVQTRAAIRQRAIRLGTI